MKTEDQDQDQEKEIKEKLPKIKFFITHCLEELTIKGILTQMYAEECRKALFTFIQESPKEAYNLFMDAKKSILCETQEDKRIKFFALYVSPLIRFILIAIVAVYGLKVGGVEFMRYLSDLVRWIFGGGSSAGKDICIAAEDLDIVE